MAEVDRSAATSMDDPYQGLHRPLNLLVQASRTSPALREAVRQVEDWVRQRGDYKLALKTIMDVPSQETLMLNAEARAMYEIARRAIEGDVRHVG